ncbi:Neuropeptide CCHamide-1 receptor [Armadillidium nasatum]|uniref:Neuropeptide CCHamide-1 receptor n=1 Tax=Armadillidium nasatum TaxID=96803 RepID=A0A5N5TEW5_9CRUS|nr:Neuropeptide CCHamide-1 receptor [Armadillidium nasatum]
MILSTINKALNESDIDCEPYCLDTIRNLSTTPEPYIQHTERPEIYLVPIVFALIFILGATGNGALVYFFIRYPHMRNPPNTYIISLALGDLMVVVFCVPFISTIYTTRSWPFGELICRLQETVRDLSVGVTVFTLTALSSERYFAIAKPVTRRAGATHSALTNIAAIWVASGGLALPAAIFSHVRYFPISDGDTIAVCYPFPDWLGEFYPKIIVIVKFLIFYLIPLSAIGIFYCLMARHLVATTIALPGEAFHQRHRATQMAARRKVAKMVLAFVFIFALCFMPNHVFLLWFYFNPNSRDDFNNFWNAFRITGFCLGFINSCINPVTLYCISGTFRKYFNHHLFCDLCGKVTVTQQSFTRLRYHSSGAGLTSRTDQIDMSILNGPEKQTL